MTMLATNVYLGSVCTGPPNAIMTATSDCGAAHTCSEPSEGSGNIVNTSTACINDHFEYSTKTLGSSKFVIVEHYNTTGCQNLLEADAFPASGTYQTGGNFMVIAHLDDVTGAVNITL
jgi:hypothetical protein